MTQAEFPAVPSAAILTAKIALAISGALALVVLVAGWGLGVDLLVRVAPGLSAMAPSTCLCIILLCAGFLACQADGPAFGRSVAWPSAGISALIAFADLAVMAGGAATGVDALIWPEAEAFHAGSMAPATAFSALLGAACLWRFSLRQTGVADPVFVAAGTAGLLLTLVDLVGYAYDAEALYEVSIFTAMALHTAAAFALIFGAALVLRGDIGWVAILFSRTPGGAGARRLLPVALLAPFLLTFAALAATEMGLFNANFRASLLVIVMMVLLGATVLRNAVLDDRVHAKLARTTDDLRTALDDRALLLREMYHRVKNNLQEIDALLMLQSQHLEDPAAREALNTMGGRIRALSHVHGLLVSAHNPSQVAADVYLEDLCASIVSSQVDADRDVTITAEAPDTPIDIDFAITLGLLVNELVTNCLKHAFPDRAAGSIDVRYSEPSGEQAVLRVSDTGIGVGGAEGSMSPGGGVGALIIAGLVDQLGADMSVETARGRVVTITIPHTSGQEAPPHG